MRQNSKRNKMEKTINYDLYEKVIGLAVKTIIKLEKENQQLKKEKEEWQKTQKNQNQMI